MLPNNLLSEKRFGITLEIRDYLHQASPDPLVYGYSSTFVLILLETIDHLATGEAAKEFIYFKFTANT